MNKGPAAARKVLLKTRGFSRSWKTLAPRKKVTVRFAAKGKHVIIVTSKTLDPRKKNNRFKG